ncbi:MAG: hypothetical protein RBT63_08465 [Bdellovibrionales bacterium]|nr:hypothetical protein [Bdellovibrionales bacterium]
MLNQVFGSLEDRFKRLIAKNGLKLHSLDGRVKALASLEHKISRPDRNYSNIYEITDLIAFRMITYSEDLIEDVAGLIEKTFDVDYDDSANKLRSEDQQKFGYRSLHYVCSLPKDVLGLHPEIDGRFKFEIQIRTILQHAWAEIEHDIGYKTADELPGLFRRRFSQIASLLEVADREFASLRMEIKAYSERLRAAEVEDWGPVDLDKFSLRNLIEREEVKRLDQRVAQVLNLPQSEELFFPDYILRSLQAAGLSKIRPAMDEIVASESRLESFVKAYFEFAQAHWNFSESAVESVRRGYSLLFVSHLAVLSRDTLLIDKLNRITQFYRDVDYPDEPEKAKAAGRDLISRLKTNKLIEG